MDIQKVSVNYNYGSMNFKGTIGKSAIKQYQRDVQNALNELSQKANERGVSVNELMTWCQEATPEGGLEDVKVSTLELLLDHCKGIMDAVIDYMTKAHKDSKLIYRKYVLEDGKFIYKNSKLGQEVVVCDDNFCSRKHTPHSWENDFVCDDKSNLATSLLTQNYDKKLETEALRELKEKAKNTNTKLGLWLLKREGKKIEEFEQEAGMEITDTSRLIEETRHKVELEMHEQQKLEKQNREIVEAQQRNLFN